MQQLIFFLQKYKYFLYFLLLQIIAFGLTINNNSFHKSKFITSTNFVTGNAYKTSSGITSYFSLGKQNDLLAIENESLKNQIDLLKKQIENNQIQSIEDSITSKQNFSYTTGKVISNDYSKNHNYLTLNIGETSGVKKEMGVINNQGIIGITEHTSTNFTRVQSILNTSFKINAKFKNNNHFGTLAWNGEDYNIMQLTDIPRQANYIVGDTIITGGKSAIFPEGILVGTVINKPESKSAINSIDIKLFNDMSDIKYIYVIKNFNKTEIRNLEKQVHE